MRYLDLTLPEITANLALDEALLIAAEEQGAPPVLRVWEPSEMAVVLGASCRRLDDVHVDACRADGVAIARRSSGGGTVLIGPGTLNYTVVLAADSAHGLTSVDVGHAYVLKRVADAIHARGSEVDVQGLGDLTIGLRKCSGSAQRRVRKHFLVHATILYNFSLELVSRYTKLPSRQPAYREQRNHDDFLVNIDLSRDTLLAALRSAWPEARESSDGVAYPQDLVDELVVSKFSRQDWIERL